MGAASKTGLSILGLSVLWSMPLTAQDRPPAIAVSDGACPFECCTYGPWQTSRSVELLAAPNRDADIVGRVAEGDSIVGETGRVHTVPAPFLVKEALTFAFGSLTYEPGDTIWVLDYVGEGLFNIWTPNRVVMAPLGFSPYGGSAGRRCEGCSHGELLKDVESIWWVRVRTGSGLVGWTPESDAFAGKDACGCW